MSLVYDADRVGGWVILVSRATDTVQFGPFSSYGAIREWFLGAGKSIGKNYMVVPLVDPNSDPKRFWEKLYAVEED